MTGQSGPKLKGVADVVFLVDITGSMEPCITGLKNNIGAFVKKCREPDLNGGVPITDLRISVCGYRDYPADSATWFEFNPFVQVDGSIDAVQAQLGTLRATGGGDEPESLLDALFKVGSLPQTGPQDITDPSKWRSRARRVVIAFTDATFHPTISADEGRGGDWQSVGQLYMGKKLKLIVYAPYAPGYEDLGAINGSIIETYTDNLKTAPKDLERFTSDSASFSRTLSMLAKTVTVEAAPEVL
jgi:hypothetical protein